MFKQPRVPEYRESAGTGKYLKDLTIFLKDFCLNSWRATTMLERDAGGGVSGMSLDALDELLERRRLEREHPVGGAPYLTMLPQEEDDPNVKWPWSKWTLDMSGRFLLGASEAHPLGETGGGETHMLTAEELPEISGTISLGAGTSGATGGGYGAVRVTSGVFSGEIAMQYGRPTNATAQAYVSNTTSYRDVRMRFGGGQAHSIMPPYLAVNIWIRTE